VELASSGLLLLVFIAGAYAVTRFLNQPRLLCTRCEGTGLVDEKWPDPKKEGGWHRLEGKCPKCRGKGRVSGR